MVEAFNHEQAELKFGYLAEGWKLKPVTEQAAILVQHFPGLDISLLEKFAASYTVIPSGLVVIPKISVIAARFLPNEWTTRPIPDWWPAYNRAMVHLLAAMKKACKWFECSADIEPLDLNLTLKTAEVYAKFEAARLGNVMVFPVQTGILHRGMIVRRGPVTFQEHEFDLDAFAVGCIILTHLEWLKDRDLAIHCAGSNYNAHPCAYPGRILAWFYDRCCLQFGDDRFEGAFQLFGRAPFVLTE